MTVKDEDVKYLIRATNEEAYSLWLRFNKSVSWEQVPRGLFWTVGLVKNLKGKKLPVCVSVLFVTVGGHIIATYDSPSQMVDWQAVDEAVKNRFPKAIGITDPANVHDMFNALKINTNLRQCTTCGNEY